MVEGRAPGGSLDAAMLALSALLPACLAAAHLGNVADAAHDGGTARVLGLEAQPWRALDVAVGVLLAPVPVGTLAARAAMGGAIALGAAGVVLYVVTRRLLGACAQAPWLGPPVAAIAVVSALAAPAWQIEGAAVGGAVTGGLLALLPVAMLAADRGGRSRWVGAAAALGLAMAQEPLVGLCALGGCVAFVKTNRQLQSVDWRVLAGCLLAGCVPLFVAMARTSVSGASLVSALADGWANERESPMAKTPLRLIVAEAGVLSAVLGLGGLALALLVVRARPLASALATIVVLGLASTWVGAPAGPKRFGPPALVAIAAACALASVAMQAIVRAVAAARIPLARSSAAMVFSLALVGPVEGAEESLARARSGPGDAAAIWDDVVWGALPPRTVVLVTNRRVYERALAARAIGSLRGDVAVVPTFAFGVLARRALARDPALLPVWRDLELAGALTEESLSSLASARPLAMACEPHWGRTLGRHLVSLTLFDRFSPEPRGESDRRRGLDAFAPKRERLERAVTRDPGLVEATAALQEARDALLRQSAIR
jgi:hypothetical protein